jgi:hypothetical protein
MKYVSYVTKWKSSGLSTVKKVMLKVAENNDRKLLSSSEEARQFVSDVLTKLSNIKDDYNDEQHDIHAQTVRKGHIIRVPLVFEMEVFKVDDYER